jgi:hypothetical protein
VVDDARGHCRTSVCHSATRILAARFGQVILRPPRTVRLLFSKTAVKPVLPAARFQILGREGAARAWCGDMAAKFPVPGPRQEQGALEPTVPGVARLHVESNRPGVQLRRVAWPELEPDHVLCTAPCELVVDGRHGAQFYFGGDDIAVMSPFRLDGLSGDVAARVDSGPGWLFISGLTMSLVGILAVGFPQLVTWAGPGKWQTQLGGAGAGVVGLAIALLTRTTYELEPMRPTLQDH